MIGASFSAGTARSAGTAWGRVIQPTATGGRGSAGAEMEGRDSAGTGEGKARRGQY